MQCVAGTDVQQPDAEDCKSLEQVPMSLCPHSGSNACRFIPLLFSLLGSHSESLKGAAADVLTEIISKRMEPVNKLNLIQQLGLGRVCAQWGNGLPVGEEEVDLATKCAKLLAAIVTGNLWALTIARTSNCTTHLCCQLAWSGPACRALTCALPSKGPALPCPALPHLQVSMCC